MKVLQTIISVLIVFLVFSCKQKSTLFKLIPSRYSGIDFNNKIVENDSVNPFDVTNIYNGGGVGIGDFNNDGLPDIYFTGGQVKNKLYLNKGELKFKDITATAGVDGNGLWSRGVSVVDINNDGKQDIYVCTTIIPQKEKRQNLLYVNQGNDKEGIPVFKELAAEYGLNDDSYSTMAAFFDYDNDSDLDVYITVNEIETDNNPSVYRPIIKDGSAPSTGRLYRNDKKEGTDHPFFSNVSKEAGVTIEGYGHGTTVADFNRDGWKDLFVTNDFLSNDLLYINNHDGTFTDKAGSYFKHTSANGMGQDVIDINNDGLSDVVELDMDPEDNYRKKLLMSGYNYQNYQNNDMYGYQYQYVRNTLQLNQGPRINQQDSLGDPIFSEIGFYSGISSTDWSWTPLVQDFDNDGYRDIVVTNGFPKDLTDHDFIAFREKSFITATKAEVLSKLPEAKLKNYAFQNNGNTTFSNVAGQWGINTPSFSNGAAYADLDNDGDMDMVINNINDEAFLYKNNLVENEDENSNFLKIKLIGDALNKNGFGTWIEIYYDGKKQALETTPYRGYLSSIDIVSQFGIGNAASVDSVVIKWPDLKKQVFLNVTSNQILTADHKNANEKFQWEQQTILKGSLFEEITASAGITYKHHKTDVIDFNVQRLLPHKLSEYDPALASGDINGDGTDDIVIGGSYSNPTTLLLQQANEKFIEKKLPLEISKNHWQDMGILLFDADQDGDLDIYLARGGNESEPDTKSYADKLMINDGKGNFTTATISLPENFTSKSCARAADYDNDGDLDLFIAGRLYPLNYPKPVSSFIYRNDSQNGKIVFTDVSPIAAPFLKNAGMICDGLWTDFDNDGWQDLIVAGEWMPLKFYKNNNGILKDIYSASAPDSAVGWWNSITSGDYDNDGDMDYIATNLGQNSFYKASAKYPLNIYANDFYNQGTWQCIVTSFLKNKEDGELREFTTHTRDDVVEQLPFIKKRFLTYKDFANAGFEKLFTADELKNSIRYSAEFLKHVFIRNDGNGKFTFETLPAMTQYSAINGMITDDFDGDGNLDVCLNTNDFATEPSNGRYDALNGLILKGDGTGKFVALTLQQSGVFIPGNGKAIAKLKGADGHYFIAASQHKGPLKLLRLKSGNTMIPVAPGDVSALITFKDGRKQKQEFGFGNSFLSQSSRFLTAGNNIQSILISNSKGESRALTSW